MKVNERNLVNYILAYEVGELDANKVLELFAYLVKTGLAWQLQGHYGLIANALIEQGVITKDGKIDWDALM
jgi:hypothetical protein